MVPVGVDAFDDLELTDVRSASCASLSLSISEKRLQPIPQLSIINVRNQKRILRLTVFWRLNDGADSYLSF